MKLGFIGTGTMGNPMVCCLIDAGHQLTVRDIRREATTNLCEMGATWADTAREVAAASEAVFTSLPGPTEMEFTVLDPDNGILAGMPAGGAYIDMTTNSPTVFRRVAEACLSRGIEVLDAPVSGRPPRMTVMAGGDAATFAKYRPIFESMAGNIFHMGGTGAGCTTKLVTQYLGYSNFITALEGLLIGVKAGVDVGLLAQVVPVSARRQPGFRQYPSCGIKRRVYFGWFPGHRGQRPEAGLRVGPGGAGSSEDRNHRRRRLPPGPGPWVGPRRLS